MRRLAPFVLLLAAVGCSAEVNAPSPVLKGPTEQKNPPPVDPRIVCNAQMATKVTLHGDKFAPVPIDIPDAPKVALPTVTLTRALELGGGKASSDDVIVWSGDPDADTSNTEGADGKPLLTWKSQQSMSFVVQPELTLADGHKGSLVAGVYDVEVKNADGSAAVSVGSLAVADKPTLQATSPGIVCLDEATQQVTITGASLLRIGDAKTTLEIEGSDTRDLSLDGCNDVAHKGLDAEYCTRATLTLDQGSLDVGYHALTLQNPATAACHSEESVKLRVVGKPTIDRVVEPLACVAQKSDEFTIEGAGFLSIDDALPTVTIAGVEVAVTAIDGCEALETMGATVEVCSSVSIRVDEAMLDPGLHPVVVQNPAPADCSATAEAALLVVGAPELTNVVPPLVCLDDGPVTVVVEGEGFLVVNGMVPSVTIDGDTLAATDIAPGSDCDTMQAPDGIEVIQCSNLELTLAKESLGVGPIDLQIENPAPAGCSTDETTGLLAVVPGPTLTAATPALVCTYDGSRAVTLTGTGFLELDDGDVLPSVEIGGAAATVTAVKQCADVAVDGRAARSCKELEVTVPADALEAGRPMVQVVNPMPAACVASSATLLTVPPELTVALTEPTICKDTADTAFPLTLTGMGLLRIDGTDFTVTYEGGMAASSVVVDTAMCSALDVAGMPVPDVQTCNQVAFTIDTTGLTGTALDTIDVTLSNAHATGCPLTQTVALTVVPPPQITDVTVVGAPSNVADHVCSDKALTITVTGSDFYPEGLEILLDNGQQQFPADSVTVNVDRTEVSAVFDDGVPYVDDMHDHYTLIARNAGQCEASFPDAVIVDPTPLVFFVDPPVVYNGVSIEATVFTSGLSATAATVDLLDDDGNVVESYTPSMTPKPNRIQVTIPSGLAEGDYGIRVTSAIDCVGEASGVLHVTSDETLDLKSITPEFASPTEATAVTISANDPVTGGKVQFEATPRVYLNPNPTGVGVTAIALRAVEFVSATTLTAVIPGGQDPGSYDLIVVNPGGEVGILANAVTVTAAEPPVVDTVVPASLVANTTTAIDLRGTGFDDGATVPTVELVCKPSGSTTLVTIDGTNVSVVAGGEEASATFSTSTVSQGAICLVRITNPDGASFEYSAVSITNSSRNLSPWVVTTDLTTERRAPSLVAGRPTQTSRFLYAIGGDTGVMNDEQGLGTVHDTVESANVDVFGVMSDWSEQRYKLPEPRTFAGVARIGRFIYLVGGHDGTSAQDTLLRAQVLDPLATPEIQDIDASLDLEGEGLEGGAWHYRVSAVFPSSDPNNPDGESLPGEVLTVQLPVRTDSRRVQLTVTWEAIPGASAYRVYRSPEVNGSSSYVELLFETPDGATLSHTDIGDPTDEGVTPLPQGSLGTWHEITTSPLNVAREAHATVAVHDPAAPAKYYLYAFGGRDEMGAELDTYEFATVTVAGDGSQTVSAWTLADGTMGMPPKLSAARAELGAFVMTEDNATDMPAGDVWVYIGVGRDGGGFGTVMEAGKLQADGSLGTLTVLSGGDTPGNSAGYGFGQANNQLFAFGGAGGGASAGGGSAELCSSIGSGCGARPDLKSGAWNALGPGNNTQTRIYMGSAQESAFFFLAGGHDGTETLVSTERTVQ